MLLKIKHDYLQSVYLAKLDEETNTVYDHEHVLISHPFSENIVLKLSNERECYVKLFYRYDIVNCVKILINSRVGWVNSYILEKL